MVGVTGLSALPPINALKGSKVGFVVDVVDWPRFWSKH